MTAAVAEAEEVVQGALDALGPERVRALGMLVEARRLQDAADVILIKADLAEEAPGAYQAWQDAQASTKAAEAKLEAPQARLEHLQAELAECQRGAAEVGATGEDDALEDRIRARSLRIAFTEEEQAIRERIHLVMNMLSPLLAEVQGARFAEGLAAAEGAVLVEADKDPLGHERAHQTEAYQRRMARIFGEVLAIPGHPDWHSAVAALKAVLRISGIGEQVQLDAIEALSVGDPAAVAASTTRKSLESGQTVINTPGQPPVIYQGRATSGDIAWRRVCLSGMGGPAPRWQPPRGAAFSTRRSPGCLASTTSPHRQGRCEPRTGPAGTYAALYRCGVAVGAAGVPPPGPVRSPTDGQAEDVPVVRGTAGRVHLPVARLRRPSRPYGRACRCPLPRGQVPQWPHGREVPTRFLCRMCHRDPGAVRCACRAAAAF